MNQNNANLFWDNTNARLGIGSTTPTAKLVVTGAGTGTGKTFLAVAVGLTMLLEKKIERIILSRPAVEAGKSGDLCTAGDVALSAQPPFSA